jgi:uncharacterized protein YecT (DUF1311 family)
MTPKSRIALAVASIALLSTAYVAGRHAAYGQTQAEMDKTAYQDFQKEDKQLNIIYKQVLKEYDPKDQYQAPTYKKIIAAERAWITYRDAESNMEASMDAEGGSMYPMSFYESCAYHTQQRIDLLKKLLKELHSK